MDKIDKDSVLFLVEKAFDSDVEWDEFKPEGLPNKVHAIIYKDLVDKLKDFVGNKERIKKKVFDEYAETLHKYCDQSTETDSSPDLIEEN